MQWNDHSRLVGQHAFLGASKYHWLNYDTQRLVDAFMSCQAKEKGTRLHAFAAECINLKQKLVRLHPAGTASTLHRCNRLRQPPESAAGRSGFALSRPTQGY